MIVRESGVAAWIVALLLVTAAGGAGAAEWTNWRGDAYNGTSTERGLPSSWTPGGENMLWHAPFVGRSTPVVVDGRVCVIGRTGETISRQEVVSCFDAVTGELRWEDRYNVFNTTVPFNRLGWASLTADPRTGVVYAHGAAGHLRAYKEDGRLLWSRFLAEEIGRLSGYGGRTQTPIIDGDQLLLSFVSANWGEHAAPRHRYYSFDKRNGDLLWISTPGKMVYDMNTQSVPVVAEIDGTRMLIGGNADGHVYAMKVGTGEKIWGFELGRRGMNSSVIVDKTTVYASHSEENLDDAVMGRMVAIDATGTGDVTATHETWRLNEFTAGFPSPTIHDGTIYHVDNSANLSAIDAASGTVRWTHELGTVGKGSPVWADGKLYVTETNGRFHILKPGKDGVQTLDMDEITMPDGRYAEIYASAAISDGRIYLSTEAGLFCIGDSAKAGRPVAPSMQKVRKTNLGLGAKGAAPHVIRVAPAEVLAGPSETVVFRARAFDSLGRLLGERAATWSLEGLRGSVDHNGSFRASGKEAQAGYVVATVGDVTHKARVRVLPYLPFNEDFESYAVDSVPPTWVGAPGKWKVREIDGNKVLVKLFRPKGLLRNLTFFGPSTMTNATIEADVMGAKKGRRRTDMALIIGGYTLDLMGVQQRLQVRSWASEERMAQEVDFQWEVDTWYRMKLSVDTKSTKGIIRGKVWKKGEPEPEAWTIEVEDPLPIAGGSPGLVAYSPADCYYDNIKVMVNP